MKKSQKIILKKRLLLFTVISVSLTAMLIFSAGAAFAYDELYAASPQGEVPLHIVNDSESYVIIQIPACSKLELVETEGTWAKVIFQRKCGWVNMTFTENTYKEAADNTGNESPGHVKVDAKEGKTVLYSVPSSDEKLGASEKYTVPNGTVLSIAGKTENGWGLVEMTQKNMAWVKMEDTASYGTDDVNETYGIYYAYVLSKDGAGIPLYDSPEKKEEILTIPDCVRLTVRESDKGFGLVSYGGTGGWIDLSCTTDSLAGAQANAGTEVGEEFTLSGEQDINVYISPSYEDPETAVNINGTIKPGTTVYILRMSADGWGFISHNGLKGWIPPENIREKASVQTIVPEITEPFDLYVMTGMGKGLSLYTSPGSDGEKFTSVPETACMRASAEFNDYYYVENAYAAGWALKEDLSESYEKAMLIRDKEEKYVRVTDETVLKSLPIYSDLCGSEDIAVLSLNTELTIVRTVLTGKRRWGLTNYNGSWGWVNLNCTKKTVSPLFKMLAALGVCAAIVLIILCLLYLKRRRRK